MACIEGWNEKAGLHSQKAFQKIDSLYGLYICVYSNSFRDIE